MNLDLDKVSSANYMGLTVTYGDERALIVGWDGNDYTIHTESGRRAKTSNFIWDYDTLADSDTMEKNAVIAAWLSDESPYADMETIKLSFDENFGEWEAVETISGLHLATDEIARKSDPEFGGDDLARQLAENEYEYAEVMQAYNAYQEALAQVPEGDPILDDPLILLIPDMIAAASDPNIDGLANPAIRAFAEDNLPCGCDHKEATQKVGFLGALAAPAMGLATRLLPSLGFGMGMNLLGGGQEAPANMQDETTLDLEGIYANHVAKLDEGFLNFDESEFLPKEAAADELTEAMRVQVINALQAFAPNIDEGEDSSVWYSLMLAAQKAESVAELQTVLQAIPRKYHNVSPGTPPVDDGAPSPMEFPMIPGGEDAPPEPDDDGPSGIPPVDDEIIDGPVIDDEVRLPPGSAPGSGIQGGPGRRAGSVTIKKIETIQSLSSDDFLSDLGVKTADEYVPLPGVQTPSTPDYNVNEVPISYNRDKDKAVFDQAVQQVMGQNPSLSYEQAVQLVLAQRTQTQNVQPMVQASETVDNSGLEYLMDGVKTAGRDFTLDEQKEFVDEDGVARNLDLLNLDGTHYDADDLLF